MGVDPIGLGRSSRARRVFCRSCSETLIQLGENGEFEMKPEYRGKITFQEGDFFDAEESQEHKPIEMVLQYTLVM